MLAPVVKWSRVAAICGIALSGALSACEPQASPEFPGQSLLTIQGSVRIADDRTSGKLTPALAFKNNTDGLIQILDVDVEGKFPSDFRLDVYSHPSDDALVQHEDFGDDEPRVAMGHITAVTDNHPGTFEFFPAPYVGHGPSRCDANGTCRWTIKTCSDETETRCYTQTFTCPSGAEESECDVEGEGDSSLVASPWRFFAGFSNNYIVVYLKDAARSGSGTAAIYGSPHGMRTGYHLLKAREPSEDLQQQYLDCTERSEARAIELYNEEYDTEYTSDDLDLSYCGLGPIDPANCDPAIPECLNPPEQVICDQPLEEQDRFIETVRVGALRAQIELGCHVSQFEPVRDPASARIAIEITPDAQPAFGPTKTAVF